MHKNSKTKTSLVSLITLVLVCSFATAANSSDSMPFYTNVNTTPVNLLSNFPENPATTAIDERLIQSAINSFSQPGLLMRSLNSVSIPDATSAIVGSNPGASVGTYCSAFDDPKCANLSYLYYQISLTPCLTSTQTDCISNFSVVRPNGKIEIATPIAPLSPNEALRVVEGEVARNIPNGGIPYVWTFPNLEHRGGKLFVPQVTLMNYGATVSSANRSTFKFDDPEFKIAINPVSPSSSSSYVLGNINQGSYRLLPDTFLDESAFTLEFRTSIPWRTWIRSTVTDFELTTSQLNGNYFYKISGKPAKVPVIAQVIPWSQKNIDVLRAIDLGGVTVARQCDGNSKNDPYQCKVALDIGMGKANFDTFFSWFASAEPFADSKATLAPYRWTAESVPAFKQLYGSSIFGEGLEGGSCVRDYGLSSPMGVTSSNATLATDGPPTWDKSSASLSYKVAALHSLPNGDDFVGHYTLQIPRKLAECLWGKDASKSKAEISVFSTDGSSQVVTATTGVSGDYFRFKVAGFHFSSPKISISLKAQQVASPKPSASAILKKLTCVKGKTTKVVTGSAPKCPAGYKKK